jgi:4-alpha-glucanotransferase
VGLSAFLGPRFVQWSFDTQCAALKRHANESGVSLMGDVPIFVAHDSADCWSWPALYLLDENFQTTVVAGVPPDDLSPLGQRWGNPLYRWDRMADQNYAWWTARVKRALDSADVFRIDHLGLAHRRGRGALSSLEPLARRVRRPIPRGDAGRLGSGPALGAPAGG